MLIKSLDDLNNLTKKIITHLNKIKNIYLYGEIGTGKTTFTKLLINNLQKKNKMPVTIIPSPTYNLMNKYVIKDFEILHYDFFRLQNKYEIDEIGFYKIGSSSIKIVEWPELIEEKNKLEFYFKIIKNDIREINYKGFGNLKDLKIIEI